MLLIQLLVLTQDTRVIGTLPPHPYFTRPLHFTHTPPPRSAEKTNPSLHVSELGFKPPSCWPGTSGFSWVGGASLPFALGVGGLEDAGGRHEILDVLAEDLVLWLKLQVLLLDCVHPRWQICRRETKKTKQNLMISIRLVFNPDFRKSSNAGWFNNNC